MKKYILMIAFGVFFAVPAIAQTNEQIKERINADRSLEPKKKTEEEKKTEKAAKKNKDRPLIKSPDSTGLVTSTLLNLFLMPALYLIVARREQRREEAEN